MVRWKVRESAMKARWKVRESTMKAQWKVRESTMKAQWKVRESTMKVHNEGKLILMVVFIMQPWRGTDRCCIVATTAY